MSLVSTAEVRALVNTSMPETSLQAVIDRIDAQVTGRVGAPPTDLMTTTITKTFRGEGFFLFAPTEIYAVVSISEDGNALASSEYQQWAGGVIERLPHESYWGDRMTVVYKPADDRLLRTQVIIDLVRLTIERTAMKAESIAGEYSYTAPDNWDAEFKSAMRRLMFKAV